MRNTPSNLDISSLEPTWPGRAQLLARSAVVVFAAASMLAGCEAAKNGGGSGANYGSGNGAMSGSGGGADAGAPPAPDPAPVPAPDPTPAPAPAPGGCTCNADCDDGSAATLDSCSAGTCTHTAIPDCTCDADCDDGAAVTDDKCTAGTCTHTLKPQCTCNADCDDGDATTDDACNAGTCSHVKKPACTVSGDCDDKNVCTADSCSGGACQHITQAGKACDDGDACTVGDACKAGGCSGSAKSCDDGDPCTTDACQAGNCAHTALMTAACCPAQADIGVLASYNVFSCGDYVVDEFAGGTDIEGHAAVGKWLWLRSFSVGTKKPGGDALICGGNVNLSNGTVHGNLVYGMEKTLTQSVTLLGGKAIKASPINFDAACAGLEKACTALGALPATGTTKVNAAGEIVLTGKSAGLNVFTVAASDMNKAKSFAINVPAGATALVNVIGAGVSIHDFAFFLGAGVTPEKVLFNFPQTVDLSLNAVSIQGSVLAPFAVVNFNNAHIDGGMAAMHLYGNGEFHDHPFGGTVVPSCK